VSLSDRGRDYRLEKAEADRQGYTLPYLPIYEYEFRTHAYLTGAGGPGEAVLHLVAYHSRIMQRACVRDATGRC
jgi:hypothetical protein